MLAVIASRGAEIGACGTCMDARGLTEPELVDGVHRSTLENLTDWTRDAGQESDSPSPTSRALDWRTPPDLPCSSSSRPTRIRPPTTDEKEETACDEALDRILREYAKLCEHGITDEAK